MGELVAERWAIYQHGACLCMCVCEQLLVHQPWGKKGMYVHEMQVHAGFASAVCFPVCGQSDRCHLSIFSISHGIVPRVKRLELISQASLPYASTHRLQRQCSIKQAMKQHEQLRLQGAILEIYPHWSLQNRSYMEDFSYLKLRIKGVCVCLCFFCRSCELSWMTAARCRARFLFCGCSDTVAMATRSSTIFKKKKKKTVTVEGNKQDIKWKREGEGKTVKTIIRIPLLSQQSELIK